MNIKSVRMFILRGCPYCRSALRWMDELIQQNETYQGLKIEIIDESEQYALAKAHNYFLVPTWYVDGKKAYEGAATKDIVKKVLDSAIE